jgi:GDPmannose 4,6-dehydratase
MRLNDIYEEPQYRKIFYLHYGDLLDSGNIYQLINTIKPDEIYNLAAQSHVGVSFKTPVYTSNVNALGTLRILEAIKEQKKKIKFYQAGTSEMFGKVKEIPQNEKTPFYPRSPYGSAKLYAHWITINYREAYKIFACNGILFNHESPFRGETFVTKKIISALVQIKSGSQNKLYLGNLYAKRDWGHARDYVEAMWKIMNHKQPKDYVIATGKQNTVKNFINIAAKELEMKIIWKGKGINEKGHYNNKIVIQCDKKYLRPLEVDTLLGDASKAQKELKWKARFNLKTLIQDMIREEIDNKNF